MSKKIILTTEQFTKICESLEDSPLTTMDFMADNESNIPEVGDDAVNKIIDNGGKNVQVRVNTNNNVGDNINISGVGETAHEQFTDAVNKVKQSGMDSDNVNYVVNLDANGNPMKNENKCVTKKMIEEARLNNIKKNGKTFTKQELNEAFLGEASNSNLKRKYVNYLYNGLKNLTNKMYKDDNWEGVSNIYKTLQHMLEGKGDVEMWVERGGYWKQMGEFPNYKEYKIKVTTNDGIEINGSLKCHAAGTMENTFKYYDITVTWW